MHPRKLLLPAGATLLAGALVAADLARDTYDLRPRFEEGQKLEIENEVTLTVGLDDAAASFAGQPLPATPSFDMEVVATQVIQEELLAVAEGKPKKLRRYHDTMGVDVSGEVGMGGQTQSIDESQELPLSGRTLELTVDDEGTVTVEDVGEDDEPLDESVTRTQSMESHFEALLPKDEVEVGDSWDVGAAMLDEFTRQASAQAEGDEDVARLFEVMKGMLEDYDGEATGKLVSIEGDEAKIEWTMSAEITVDDLFELVRDIADPEDIEGMPEDADGSLELAMEAEGHGVFDLAKHQLVSLELEGEYTLSAEISMSQDGMEISGNADLSGSIEVTGSVTIEE